MPNCVTCAADPIDGAVGASSEQAGGSDDRAFADPAGPDGWGERDCPADGGVAGGLSPGGGLWVINNG